jgi:TonB family protein
MGSVADLGPSLLLDWYASMERPRWVRAGLLSLVTHAVLIAVALFAFNLDTHGPVQTTEVISNFRKVTPLYLPLELTQKAPNRGKIAREVNAEDLLPRPASQQRLPPAPAVRTFRPPIPQNPALPQPAAPNVPEPPKVDAALNPPPDAPAPAGTPKAPTPPQIQPVEQPKLAFERPGQNGPSPDTSPGRAKLTPPKATVDEAIRSITRSGGAEIEQPPSLAPSPQLPPSPGQLGSPLELLSDPQGADFKPYLARILALVRQNWLAIIPQSARMGAKGTVVLEFAIDRSGQVLKVVIATPSGSQVLDKAAVAAISASVPFPPLPPDYKGLSARLQFAFKYNFK